MHNGLYCSKCTIEDVEIKETGRFTPKTSKAVDVEIESQTFTGVIVKNLPAEMPDDEVVKTKFWGMLLMSL